MSAGFHLTDLPDVVAHVTPAVYHVSAGDCYGSGFALPMRPDDSTPGVVVTNAHVVALIAADGGGPGGVVRIHSPGEADQPVGVRLIDPSTDVALLQLGAPAPHVIDCRKDGVRVGEPVIIVGSQLADEVHAHGGYEASVTFGIVSAIGRSGTGTDRIPFEGVIQTDAAGYEGGSGGPLVDVFGSAIGIHYAGHPMAQNINFAIPIAYALDAYAENCETGSTEIRRASVGVRTGTHRFAPKLAARYGQTSGAAVLRPPRPGSPADIAGLLPGDVIVRLDGEGVSGSAALFRCLNRHLIGKEIALDIIREGKIKTVAITPTERRH